MVRLQFSNGITELPKSWTMRSSVPWLRGLARCINYGYTGNSGDWQDKLFFVSQGFSVAALECRGPGDQSEDRGVVVGNTYRGHITRGLDDHPDKLLFHQIFLDTSQLARIVIGFEEVNEARVAGPMVGPSAGRSAW